MEWPFDGKRRLALKLVVRGKGMRGRQLDIHDALAQKIIDEDAKVLVEIREIV